MDIPTITRILSQLNHTIGASATPEYKRRAAKRQRSVMEARLDELHRERSVPA